MEKVITTAIAAAIVFVICYAIPAFRESKKFMSVTFLAAFSTVCIPIGGFLGLLAFGLADYFYERRRKKQVLASKKVYYSFENAGIDTLIFLVYFILKTIIYSSYYETDVSATILASLIELVVLLLLMMLYRYALNHTPFAPEYGSPIATETTVEELMNIPAIVLPFFDECLRAPLTEKEKEKISGDLPLIQSLINKPEQQKEVDNYLAIKLPKRVFSLNKVISSLEITEGIEPTEDEIAALRYSYLYNATYSLYVDDKDLQGLAKNTLLAAHHSSAETRKTAYDELLRILTENKIFERSVEQIMNNIKGKEAFFLKKFKSFDESDSSILEMFKGVLPQLCYSANIKDDYLIDAFSEALKRLNIDLDTYEAPDPDVVEF